MHFEPGRIVLRRFFKRADTMSVVTYGRVAATNERGLLLWVAEGTPVLWIMAADGRSPRDMPFPEWIVVPKRLDRRVWQGPGVLMLALPAWLTPCGGSGVPAAGSRAGHLAGIDTVDHDRGHRGRPGSVVALQGRARVGAHSAYPEHYWVDDPAAVRHQGEGVTKLIEAGEFPFDGTWCDFLPEPSWLVPVDLPAGWDRPRAW